MDGSVAGHLSGAYRLLRLRFFRWRYSSHYVYKCVLVLLFAALTGTCAQIRIYTPWSPVPITMQVFAVLLSGVLLGRWYGGLSQVAYVSLGALGVPWFAPKPGAEMFTSGGFAVLIGATGGYIIGFIAASFLIGHLVDTYVETRRFIPQMLIMVLGVLIIYAAGYVHLYAWFLLHAVEVTPWYVLEKGVLLFIPVDLAKSILASGISTTILPKERFDGEVRAPRLIRRISRP